MNAIWQQVFALDARYNTCRAPHHANFRTLYIRRRNQLLKEFVQNDFLSFRKFYLKLRSHLLQQRYGNIIGTGSPLDQISLRSRTAKGCSKALTMNSSAVSPCGNQDTCSVVPTKEANASRAIVGGTSISENYAFVGVHHIFDQHFNSVPMIKFANNDRSKLCCASYDGTISICNVRNSPPSVDIILKGHEKAVTNCDWSISNDLVVTSSLDCTVRLWDYQTGKCLRVVRDFLNSEVLSCVFQPANNNMIVAGNAKGLVYILNISAGIYPKGGSVKVGSKVLSIACDSSGKLIWAGTEKGIIFSFSFEPGTGKLHKRKKIVVSENNFISCISWRAWISREARTPSLLVNCAANVLCLYRVIDLDGGLQLKKKFAVHHTKELIRSTFCPIMSFRPGACIVTGSEDSCIYFIDIEKDERPVVNKLQAHSCPVLGISFNYDESLLATSDVQGLIIIWKRATETDP